MSHNDEPNAKRKRKMEEKKEEGIEEKNAGPFDQILFLGLFKRWGRKNPPLSSNS